MLLFIGLGNPGKKYERTRHNAGFRALDLFHASHGDAFSSWQKKFSSEIAEGVIGAEKIILMKPATFMNASGDAASPAVGFWKLDPKKDACIVYDDLDIPLGDIRVRESGSAGGHNGMKSIVARLGTQDVPRIRIGIGTEREKLMPSEDFVLESFSEEEEKIIGESCKKAAEEMEKIIAERSTRSS